jgi:lipid A 3-O-deacylase
MVGSLTKLSGRVAAVLLTLWFASDAHGQSGQQSDQLGRNVDTTEFKSNDFKFDAANVNYIDSDLPDADAGHRLDRGTQTLSLEAGGNYGVIIFGGNQRHDLALASLSYGCVLSPTMAKDHWFRGNWELRAELFGGSEFKPNDNWVAGFTPHIRYNFATGTKWVPFADAGAGVTGTGIGPPDLSHIFEFNLQLGAGLHRVVRSNLALTFEVKYFHMSCAGLSSPNLGLNGVTRLIGLTKFF